jgi:hypothetical protein
LNEAYIEVRPAPANSQASDYWFCKLDMLVSNMNRCALSAVILFTLPLSAILSLANAQEPQGADCTGDTVDCSAHEAGYEWADLNNVDSVDDCSGNSDSFVEGCQAYVAENQSDQDETTAPVADKTKKEEEGGVNSGELD